MQPRGIRNNNPLNIKIGNDWLGERPNNDGVFEEFEKMEYGVRAAVIILRRYIIKYGRNNLRKIIHSWSPDGETAERAYMQSVSQWCNLPLDTPIDFNDANLMCKIVQGMARVENGQVVDINIIRKGYEMACNRLPMS